MTLTLALPDGSQQTFVDTISMGRYKNYSIVNGQEVYLTRGTNFTTIDGSSMTFISDAPISDGIPISQFATTTGQSIYMPTGYIISKDGTRHRVENGLIKSTKDVDGNQTFFTYYESQTVPYIRRLSSITDSLGREVSITYDVNDNANSPDGTPYGLRDEISYQSLNGSPKKIIITKADLGSALRNGFTLKSFYELWGDETSNTSTFTKQVISAVWTADAKAIKFKYNSFGELAKVSFPTGGAVEYDHDYGSNFYRNNILSNYNVLRRVAEKRVYTNGGDSASLVNKTTFSNIYPQRDADDSSPLTTLPVQMDVKDGNNNLLSRSNHYFKGDPINATNPNGDAKGYGIEDPLNGKEIKTEVINPLTQEVYQRVEYNWQMRVPGYTPTCIWQQPCYFFENYVMGRDPLLVESKTTLEPNNGGCLVTKITAINPFNGTLGFDTHNNQTDVWEYDYGVGNTPSTPARHNHTDYLTVSSINGLNYSEPANGQNYTLNDLHLRGLPIGAKSYSINTTTGVETLLSQREIRYDESSYALLTYSGSIVGWTDPNTTARGNATTARTWFAEENRWIETHAQFDQFGNSRKVWDAKGNFSETQYTDNYSDNVNRNSFAFPTKTISVVPDTNNGQNGSSQPFETMVKYDFTTGLPMSATDVNGQTTTTEYNDPMLRPTAVVAANGTRTETIYNDVVGDLWVKRRSQFDANIWTEAKVYLDGLGRTVKTESIKADGNNVFVETEYDNLGRVKRTTNPYRANEQKLWGKPRYDELGRTVESFAPAPDGQTGNSLGTTSYSISTVANYVGTVVVSTDASLRKTRSITNSLGQLIRVDEPTATGGTETADLGTLQNPTQPTYYKYSSLGNMVEVTQGGQKRYFLYDSLGRLIRVRQPEQAVNAALNLMDTLTGNSQWTAAFSYDVLGNVLTAIDAKGVTITSSYDNQNRVTMRNYAGEATGQQTPAITYKYDNLPFGKGKLIETSNTISTSKTIAFDNLGRPLTYQQITDGQTYTSSYQYNLSGALVQETYPSNRVVKNEYKADGDLSRIFGNALNQVEKTYANGFVYTASGAIERLRLGNGRWENAKFNARLQTIEIGLGTSATNLNLWKVNYDYGEIETNGTLNTTKNTGNIAKQTLNLQGLAQPFIQTYKYDSLNRLTEARETNNGQQTWQQTFGYDRFGNRTGFSQIIGTQQLVLNNQNHPSIDATTNRFTTGQGYTYDFNGNLIQDAQGRQFTFNGENKQTLVKDVNNQIIGQYFYDGNGARVKKVTNTETTVFVYSGGKLIAEYSTQPPPQNPTTSYTTTDQLGSPRVITNAFGQVTSRRDFLPFGGELYPDAVYRKATDKYGAADSVRQRFTGYQNDTETGLDFAEARYYNNQHGRFTAVDPLLASGKSANPQSFNRYVYTSNNPLVRVDRNGLDWWDIINTTTNTRSIYWSVDKPLGGDGITVSKWTDYVYKASDNRWYALNPNANESEGFPVYEGAYWRYGSYTNYGGSFDGFLYSVIHAKDLANLVGSFKTGDLNGSFTSFGKIAIENGVAGGVSNFYAPIIEKGIARVFSSVGARFGTAVSEKLASGACFVAGTPVHTNKGLKAIEKIKAGDKVLSWDEKTKQFEYKTVVNAFVKQAREIVKVRVKGEKKVIEATPEHPFYVRTFHQARDNTSADNGEADGEWKGADSLQIGDELLRPNGTWTKVIAVEIEARQETVYNFEVEDNHDYFVGEKGTLVHNGDCLNIAARALTAADFGVSDAALTTVRGTFAVTDEVATAQVDLIAGNIGRDGFRAFSNLIQTARQTGANSLRIEATIANETLLKYLERTGATITSNQSGSKFADVITINFR